jgi:hypothetical protein
MNSTFRLASQLAAALAVSALLPAGASAATTANLTVLPASPGVSTATITPVMMDAAPGFSYGNFANNGGATKSEVCLVPTALFGRDVSIGEIASISYWTKNSFA